MQTESIWVLSNHHPYPMLGSIGAGKHPFDRHKSGEDALRMFCPTGADVPRPEDLPRMGKLFMERPTAETDEDFVQPIPYILLLQDEKLIRYRRQPRRVDGETRLAGKTSVGIGGHLSAAAGRYRYPDDTTAEIIEEEMWREVFEEFAFKLPVAQNTNRYIGARPNQWPRVFKDGRFCFAGYLVDRTDAVGRVHLGLVYVLEILPEVRVEIAQKERHKLTLEEPIDPADAMLHSDMRVKEMENWSQLVIENWEQIRPST